MNTPLTGKRLLLYFVAGFGIVIGVNFYMASLAVSGFSGVVVKNSYVASQEFNGWLEEAERQQALGWAAQVTRAPSGHLAVSTQSVPTGAVLNAELRRPLGQPDARTVTFDAATAASGESADYVSVQTLPAGRWIIRLTITADDDIWMTEDHL